MRASNFAAYHQYALNRDRLRWLLNEGAQHPGTERDVAEVARLLWSHMEREARIANEEAARGDR